MDQLALNDEMRMLVWKVRHPASANLQYSVNDQPKWSCSQVALKCSDLGHLASIEKVHRKWVEVLEEEMFRQGDRERELGYPISPLMNRDKGGITKSQPGFFDFVALPLFTSFVAALPSADAMLQQVKANRDMWLQEEDSLAADKSGQAPK